MKRNPFPICILLVLTLLSVSCFNGEQNNLKFEKLTCESLVDPLGIENPNPFFSWIMNAGEYDGSQSVYQILVASSPDLLSPGKADMWDSERVNSAQSVNVEYAGETLHSGYKYWWAVKMWDQDGEVSAWSVPQNFEMGLFEAGNWQNAQWISLGEDTRESEYRFREFQTSRMEKAVMRSTNPSGYFRKEFGLKGRVKEARAYICGLGYYELYLNGKKVGDHVLDPAPTSYDHHALYVTYDITTQLLAEENTLGVILGNGFYGQNIAFAAALDYGIPAFKILVRLSYEDGTSENVISDGDWKASTGPILYDNVYAGETYDARLEQPGWNENGFEDSEWQIGSVSSPEVAEIRSQLMPPIRKIKQLDPVNIFQGGNGNWIVDFGQNIAGWVKISVQEEAGQVIEVRTAESLTRRGDEIHPGSLGKMATGVNQLDVYICKGSGREEWEPRFTYQAFQFAEISGLSEKPTVESVKAILVCNDMVETGEFSSSDPLLNKMVEVSKWTVIDNLHGFPEDCPAREKCGWLGDAHATAEFNMFTYDMNLLFAKYSGDIQSQLIPENGKNSDQNVTFMVPTQVAPGKRSVGVAKLDWGIAEVYIPWYLYLHYGNRRPIQNHYSEMKELLGYYLTFKNENGVIENGLGDWCPPRWDRQDNPGAMECHPFISANAYFYDILEIMTRIANMMDETVYARVLSAEREALGEAFNSEFLEDIGDEGARWYGSQTATVMALQFGMVPASVRDDVIEGLKYDIVVNNNGHHTTGIHGNRYLYSLLNELGEEELSYSVLTHPEFRFEYMAGKTMGMGQWDRVGPLAESSHAGRVCSPLL